MSASRPGRMRRLLGDLRRSESRGDAIRRVRRRAGVGLRAVTGRPATTAGTPGGSGGRVTRSAAWYVGEWGRLAGAVLGPDAPAAPLDDTAAPGAIKAARRHRAQAALAASIARGEGLDAATCHAVASLCETLEWNAAWSLAEGVGRLPGGAAASAMGHGVLLHRRRQHARAWTRLRGVADAELAATIPVEAVDAALADGSREARERALAIGAPTAALPAAAAVDLAGRYLVFAERDAAAALVADLRQRPSIEIDARRRHALGLIEGWLEPRPASVAGGAVPFAVLDYQSPDHVLTSGNVGDYIQTLAAIGNLVRLEGVTFSGEEGLGELATELQARVRPDLRAPGPGGAVHLVKVDRDVSSVAAMPDGTWALAFGWHMHPLFDLRYDFPYHRGLRPIFVSFHVNRLEMVSEEALAYLRRHGPVGCRDWNTVFLLLGAGVDAFFSGCLTTTVDALFPPRATAYRGAGTVGVIDAPRHAAGRNARDVRVYGHQSEDVRSMSLVEGLRAADATLAGYQRDLARAVTGRLHAYLPLTALGVPTEFRHSLRGDVRFAGLMGLQPDDERLEAIRGGIRELLAGVLARIVSGASEDVVYAHWRAATADRLAEARERFSAPLVVESTTVDVAAAVAASRAGSRRSGPHHAVDPATVTDVVLAFDQNLTWPAAVLVESLVANASGPLRLWVLARGLAPAYQEWLGTAFPDLPITILPCDGISYGPGGRPRRVPARITISTMDRLLLPELLEDVRRVVYLDVDTLALDDICRLAATDLDGHPVAARDSYVTEASEWQRAGRALDEAEATDLRRWMSLEHGVGHAALNAGVLVMDLERMRGDDFTARYLGWVERYGLHDQDTMLAYVGPQRRVLEPRWNTLPVLEDVERPGLIHWAELGKPWERELTYAQERWQGYAARLQARAGSPPSGGDPAADADAVPGSLANPVPVGPRTDPLRPAVEAVIAGVRGEHLSYLDAGSLRTLAATVEQIEADGVDGLIIEAGTALGGSAITMASAKSPARRMRVYDVFGMIPPPGERDGDDVHRRYRTIVAGASTGIGGETYYGYRDDLLAEVTASFARHGVPVDEHHVELVRGRFEDTMAIDEPVALAHLDGDWYASTMTCLTRIAPRLAVGGRLVIDDYDTWSGCRTAVHEYFADRPGFRFERRGRLHIVRV